MLQDDKADQTNDVPDDIKNIFTQVTTECLRSSTKEDLHSNKKFDLLLAIQLAKVIAAYGEAIASAFQRKYEKTNPGLSFLFAQVTNAVVERTFHDGRCHLQAVYSLFELHKHGIFNVSLVRSCTGNPDTEHWYLILPDQDTFEFLSHQSNVYALVKPNIFNNKDSLFFDAWSNQLCRWGEFYSDDKCTKALSTAKQAVFKPFVRLFDNELGAIKNILWCFSQYEIYLKGLLLSNREVKLDATQITNSLSLPEDKFQEEMKLLTSSEKCIEKLLSTIASYKAEFTETLRLQIKNSVWANLKTKYGLLSQSTGSGIFFPEEFVGIIFRRAAHQNCISDMKVLCEHFNVDVNSVGKETGKSALHFAAEQGHLNVITWLLEKGAKLHLKDKNNLTPQDIMQVNNLLVSSKENLDLTPTPL